MCKLHNFKLYLKVWPRLFVCDKTVSHLVYTCLTRSSHIESSSDSHQKIPAVTLCHLCRCSCLCFYSLPWKKAPLDAEGKFVKRSAIWLKQAKTSVWHKYLAVLFRRHTSDHYDRKVCHCPMWVTARCEAQACPRLRVATSLGQNEANCNSVSLSSVWLPGVAHISISGDKLYCCCTVCDTFMPKKGLKLNWKPFPVIAGNGTPSSKRNRCIRV